MKWWNRVATVRVCMGRKECTVDIWVYYCVLLHFMQANRKWSVGREDGSSSTAKTWGDIYCFLFPNEICWFTRVFLFFLMYICSDDNYEMILKNVLPDQYWRSTVQYMLQYLWLSALYVLKVFSVYCTGSQSADKTYINLTVRNTPSDSRVPMSYFPLSDGCFISIFSIYYNGSLKLLVMRSV